MQPPGSQGQDTWLGIAFAEQAQIQVQSLHPSIQRHERDDPRLMSFVDLVAAIVILSNAVKGVSILQLSRDPDCA
jgi:hypothetical protein